MRSPQRETLQKTFNIDAKTARLVKRIAAATGSKSKLEAIINKHCPKTAAYGRSCYNNPYAMQICQVTMALHAINDLVGGYGVEGLGPGRSGDYAPSYEYINMGDTYETTLVYRRSTDNLYIGNWGAIAERHPSW